MVQKINPKILGAIGLLCISIGIFVHLFIALPNDFAYGFLVGMGLVFTSYGFYKTKRKTSS